jgi:amino acid transporter
MKDKSVGHKPEVLKRVLGFPSLFVIAVGIVAAQSCFVSTLQGAGLGGASFLIALWLAFILTLCYVSTYSELSLMMPKAGSISTYTAVAIGHFPAIIATLSGYLAPILFAGPAELILVENILHLTFPDMFAHIGLLILAVFTILNLLGINIFSAVQSILTYAMLLTMLIIGFRGIHPSSAHVLPLDALWQGFSQVGFDVFSLVVLAIWAFLSLEFICPLIEESKQPEKNIPKTMFLGAIIILIVHSLIAYTGMRHLPAEELIQSNTPHWLLVNHLFKDWGWLMITIFAITTTSGIINSTLATIPRVLFGMAHHRQLPSLFKVLHPRWETPWLGILFVAALQAIPLLILANSPNILLILVISAATCWLLTYIIAHIDVLVLRKKYPHFKRPFKSPIYPIPQVLGIVGMGYALFNNAPTPELTVKVYTNAALFIGVTAIYAFFWVKYKMKRALFEPEPI